MIQGKCQGHTMCVLIAHKKILCDSRCHGLSGGANRETSPGGVQQSVRRSCPMRFSQSSAPGIRRKPGAGSFTEQARMGLGEGRK
ncbi:hypothetical protein B0G75_106228 [Paraburkholderia sp. BL18I3N2]|nr:hypothetical protein B0G75_106228 [Paraburkholderia sp. BL18I3N2]